MRSALALACPLLALAACPPDGATTTTEGGADTSTGDPPTTTGEAAADETATPTTEAAWQPTLARGGLEIDWVEANQGVGVKIGADGKGVGGSDRSTYLLQHRVTLVRAFWKQLPADWTPREIEGRLIITTPGQAEPLVLTSRPLVDGDSYIGSLDRSFYWGLKPEHVVPGIRYRIELWEVAETAEELPESEAPARLPADGSDTFVGVEASDQVLKITIVPFNYDSGDGCVTSPDLSEETMQKFRDKMFMMNPVDDLQVEIHAAIDWTVKLTDFNELNQFMSGMRFEENAEDERYYYGYVDVCAGGLGDAGGKAFGIPMGGLKQDAWQRVSSGLSTGDTEWMSETFVHEVGHSQGRKHIYCNGMEAGFDPNYPNDYGEIGEWGFGVIDYQLYHPTVHRDYMTYCHPVWASTFGWNKVFPIIKELSSWDDEGAPAPDPDGALLVGSVYPNGREDWITVRGGVRPEQRSAVHGVEFTLDGQPELVPAAWLPQPDGDIVNIAVPLPARWDDVTAVTRVAGDTRVEVDRARIAQHHAR
jgi:hypothetical protein